MNNYENMSKQFLNFLLRDAKDQVKNFSESLYAGYFDNAVLVCVKRNIKTKMGKAFVKDEIALGNVGFACEHNHPELVERITVWSFNLRCGVSLNKNDIEYASIFN